MINMKNKDNKYNDNSIIHNIIDLYYKEIFNYCYLRLNYNKQDAEECTQETFVIFLIKWKSLSNTDNIRAWLYRTSDNVMKNYNKKTNRHKNEIKLSEIIENNNEFGYDDTGAFELLSDLTIEEQQLIIEYYLDKETANELAKKYKVSESAIFMRIHRIKEKLKKIYLKENKM